MMSQTTNLLKAAAISSAITAPLVYAVLKGSDGKKKGIETINILKEHQELKAKLNESEARVSQLNREVEANKSSEETLKFLEGDNERLRAEIAQYTLTEKVDLESKIQKLELELSESKAQREELRSLKESTTESDKALVEKVNALAISENLIQQLKDNLKASSTQVKSYEAEKSTLIKEAEKYKKAVSKLEIELKESESNNASLTKKLNKSQETILTLEKQVKVHEAVTSTLKADLKASETAAKEIQILQNQIEDLNKVVAEKTLVSDKVPILEAQNQTLRDEVQEKVLNEKKLESEINQFKEELNKKDEEIKDSESLKDQVNELEKDLKAKESELQKNITKLIETEKDSKENLDKLKGLYMKALSELKEASASKSS